MKKLILYAIGYMICLKFAPELAAPGTWTGALVVGALVFVGQLLIPAKEIKKEVMS